MNRSKLRSRSTKGSRKDVERADDRIFPVDANPFSPGEPIWNDKDARFIEGLLTFSEHVADSLCVKSQSAPEPSQNLGKRN